MKINYPQVIKYLSVGLIGFFLGSADVTYTLWQFWVIIFLVAVVSECGEIIGRNKKEQKK